MPITTTEIAKQLGISRQTVSYALNGGRGRVRPELRKQIEEASRELGYRPNAVANAMRTGRFSAIGLVTTTLEHHSYLPGPLMEGIHAAINDVDLHLVTTRLPNAEFTNKQRMPKLLRELLVDGLLVSYTHDIPEQMQALIKQHQLPSIWMNSNLSHDAVRPDDRGGARQATEHLLSTGHRRIVYMDMVHKRRDVLENKAHYSIADRHVGYEQAMQSAGLTPRFVALDDVVQNQESVTARNMDWAFDGSNAPTAILSYSETGVISLALAASQRGLAVPDNLQLVTFADRPVCLDGIAVDTVVLPFEKIGRRAINALSKRIANPSKPLKTKLVPCELHFSSSVARTKSTKGSACQNA